MRSPGWRTHAAYQWQRKKARLTLAWFRVLDTWDELRLSRTVGRIVAPVLAMIGCAAAFVIGWLLLLAILAVAAVVMVVRWIIGPRRRPTVTPLLDCHFVSGNSLKDVAHRLSEDPRFMPRGHLTR